MFNCDRQIYLFASSCFRLPKDFVEFTNTLLPQSYRLLFVCVKVVRHTVEHY
jgi:hypothetical protein